MVTPLLNPSRLEGEHRSRVFIGGSYERSPVGVLSMLAKVVKDAAMIPVVADKYELRVPDRDIHDNSLFLLHACRLAIFELSKPLGVMMEIERVPDYGIKALALYHDPIGRPWSAKGVDLLASPMLSSFVIGHGDRISIHSYFRPEDAAKKARHWLRAMKRRLI